MQIPTVHDGPEGTEDVIYISGQDLAIDALLYIWPFPVFTSLVFMVINFAFGERQWYTSYFEKLDHIWCIWHIWVCDIFQVKTWMCACMSLWGKGWALIILVSLLPLSYIFLKNPKYKICSLKIK